MRSVIPLPPNRLTQLRLQITGAPGDSTGERLWDRLSVALCIVLTVLVALTFQDYGISTDEYVQQVYGEKLWALYLSGFADRSAFHFDNLYLYGGLFDMLAVALQRVLPFDPYDTRHLLCGLIGVLGVVGTWRLAREVAGPRCGFIAAALLALSASWYGAMFNNTKDIPFAVGMVWLVYLSCVLVNNLPKPRLRSVILFGVVLGATLGIRVAAVFALIYLALAVAVYLAALQRRLGWRAAARELRIMGGALLPAIPVSYGIMAAFWPWSVLSPLNPLRAVRPLTTFPFYTALDGKSYSSIDLPFYYLPVYLGIKLPEVTLIGLVILAGIGAAIALRPRQWRMSPDMLPRLVVVLSVAIPVLYFLLARPSLYNGMRHFFFIVPPLCVGAALALDRAWAWAGKRHPAAGLAIAVLLTVAAANEAVGMMRLHPHQYIYYNLLVGGPGGAFRRYEMDYWSNFLPQAVDLLETQLKREHGGKPPTRKYAIGLCTKEEILREYAPPYLVPTKDWQRADFLIATTNDNCDTAAGGRTVIEIVREGAVLGVVKDRRAGTTALGTSTRPAIR